MIKSSIEDVLPRSQTLPPGDEAKGWLDTTYLGKDVRISRGNKGTTVILVREAADGSGTPLPYDF